MTLKESISSVEMGEKSTIFPLSVESFIVDFANVHLTKI